MTNATKGILLMIAAVAAFAVPASAATTEKVA